MSIEKRKHKRVPRRITVRFGEADFANSGITNDLSASGAFIISQHLPAIGARVHMQLMVNATLVMFLEGEVKRHRVVPPHLRQIDKGGFGVRFLTPAELMAEAAPALKAAATSDSIPARTASQELLPELKDPSAAEAPPSPRPPSPRHTPARPLVSPAPPPPLPTAQRAAATPAPAQHYPEFEMVYGDPAQLKHAWDREIRFGGLYLKTDSPPEREALINVRVKVGFAGQEFVFAAKVVQLLSGSFKGIAIAFENRAEVEKQLRPLFA